MSPGWHSNSLHIASKVVKRTALALPVFNIDKLAGVIPMRFESSFNEILRFAIITSRFTIMGIFFCVNAVVSKKEGSTAFFDLNG